MKVTEDAIFSMLLSLMLGVFIVLAFKLGSGATIPLLAGIPSFILSITQLFIDLKIFSKNKIQSKTLFDKYGFDKIAHNLVSYKKQKNNIENNINTEKIKKIRHKEIEMLIWITGFMATIYLFGYMISIPLFIVLFLKIHSKAKWSTNLIITISVCVGIYFIFVYMLQVPFWKGRVMGGMGF